MPAWFFNDLCDVALGLSTDGFGPFKWCTHTAWLLVIFNYNLALDVCFRKDNIISMGNVSGPKKPWDMDSFLYSLLQELLHLMIGISAFDVLTHSIFILRAFLIVIFGDISTVTMLMRMKGHNGLCPCWMCSIVSVCSLVPHLLVLPGGSP
ncbi:hypothetical protein AcV7_007568 [Taiwanofungus camphoratus]|nr:hypothetical protein AcV7_007568 [Antrodia cinnamomea]